MVVDLGDGNPHFGGFHQEPAALADALPSPIDSLAHEHAPLAIEGLGRFTKTGSALLIVGIAGGAVLPRIWASLGAIKSIGLQQAFWIMIPCYLFIFYFGTVGHRVGKNKKSYTPVPIEV